jgi:hypothetical protein
MEGDAWHRIQHAAEKVRQSGLFPCILLLRTCGEMLRCCLGVVCEGDLVKQDVEALSKINQIQIKLDNTVGASIFTATRPNVEEKS